LGRSVSDQCLTTMSYNNHPFTSRIKYAHYLVMSRQSKLETSRCFLRHNSKDKTTKNVRLILAHRRFTLYHDYVK